MTETVILPNGNTNGLVTGGHSNDRGLSELISLGHLETANKFNLNAIHETSAIARENALRAESKTVEVVKDNLFEMSKMVHDVKHHVTTESSALKALILEQSNKNEALTRQLENDRIRESLRDSKADILALKIKNTATVVAI